MSKKDTSQVMAEVAQFISSLKEARFEENNITAVAHLGQLNWKMGSWDDNSVLEMAGCADLFIEAHDAVQQALDDARYDDISGASHHTSRAIALLEVVYDKISR